MGFVEQPFFTEFFLHLFIGQIEIAQPRHFHGFGVELILTAALKNIDMAADHHFLAVFRFKPQFGSGAPKHDTADKGFIVLQSKIEMTRRMGLEVGDFSLHHQMLELVIHIQTALDIVVQPAD